MGDIIYDTKPDEVYHLAAQSHVRVSFDMPEYTGDVTGLGTTRMLEAIKRLNRGTRFYQASTSELFGSAKPPQNENTPFHPPQSPYAVAKLYAYWMVENYRDGYDMFTVNGILFNHESPRRGETFVTRKITRAVAAIMAKKQDKLFLGNLDSKRDWGGYAPEYVEAMHKLCSRKHRKLRFGTGGESRLRAGLFGRCFWLCGPGLGGKYVEIDPVISVRRKSITSWQIRRKPTKNWVGNQRSNLLNWSRSWWMLIWN